MLTGKYLRTLLRSVLLPCSISGSPRRLYGLLGAEGGGTTIHQFVGICQPVDTASLLTTLECPSAPLRELQSRLSCRLGTATCSRVDEKKRAVAVTLHVSVFTTHHVRAVGFATSKAGKASSSFHFPPRLAVIIFTFLKLM